jgi:hypothetical protein
MRENTYVVCKSRNGRDPNLVSPNWEMRVSGDEEMVE